MLKRLFDITFSFVAILILSPILCLIILMLKFTGERKVFFIQERVGKGEKLFGLIKFATMLENSSSLPGGDVTSYNDPRVLPFGKFLRKTKLNELPQIFNIIKGEMSFVGPRPITPKNYSYYSEQVKEKIKSVKPGLTGVGSLVFRDEEMFLKKTTKDSVQCYREDIAPYKGDLEVWYVENQNFLLDMAIIIFTVLVIVFPKFKVVNLYKTMPRNEFFN